MSRLERDLSHLPRQSDDRGGWAPDTKARFGPVLVEAWHAQAQDDIPNAVDGARFRHSDAGACSRAIALSAAGVPASNPMDAPSHFIARQGTMMHEAFQEALQERFPGTEVEVKVGEGDRGGHMDALVLTADEIYDEASPITSAIEYKSVDGFKFKLAVGERNDPKGPDYSHVLQACLNAYAEGASEAVVVYAARGAISKQAAARKNITDAARVTAEWTLDRQAYTAYAKLEIERITAILALLDNGTLAACKIPDPELPPGALIVDPAKGTWVLNDEEDRMVDGGTTWHCTYCKHQDTCAKLPSTRTPVSVLTEIGVRDGPPEHPEA